MKLIIGNPILFFLNNNNNNNNNNSLFVPYKIKYNSSYNRSNVGYKKHAEG